MPPYQPEFKPARAPALESPRVHKEEEEVKTEKSKGGTNGITDRINSEGGDANSSCIYVSSFTPVTGIPGETEYLNSSNLSKPTIEFLTGPDVSIS